MEMISSITSSLDKSLKDLGAGSNQALQATISHRSHVLPRGETRIVTASFSSNGNSIVTVSTLTAGLPVKTILRRLRLLRLVEPSSVMMLART